jgi:formylglycine-generating enzyme required for sulfatase activity
MRLPTEAEYEFAARAGSQASRYGDIGQIAWYAANSENQTHEVAQKQPNAWGLYDVLGNVLEWTAVWYTDKYSGSSETDPHGPASGQAQALRGGAWDANLRIARVSRRGRTVPEDTSFKIGLRCVGN